MHSPELLYDVMRYGMTVSVLMLAFVLWGYGRGGVGRGYGLMSLAMVLVASSQFAQLLLLWIPAVHWYVDAEPVVRALILALGLSRFSEDRRRWQTSRGITLLVILAVWLSWSATQSLSELQRSLPASLLVSTVYIASAFHFWRFRDLSRPAGFVGAGFCFFVLATLPLVSPWLQYGDLPVWSFATAQVMYVIASASLILALYQSEKLRADFASQVQERALLRVLRSRRRVVQLREWTDVLLAQISDGVVVTNMQGTITGFNRGAEGIYGYAASAVLGKSVTMLMPLSLRPETEQEMTDTLNSYTERFRHPGESVGLHRDGNVLELEMVVSPMVIVEAEQLVAIVRDVSERKRQQEQLRFMARHDALTGLPNRTHFEDLVAKAREDVGNDGIMVFVDLDDFKLINDTLGHKAGDTALVAMSRRLSNAAGESAVVARQSGDEFVIYVPTINGLVQTREWVESLITHVRHPVRFDDIEFGLSCSIGVTLCDEHDQRIDMQLMDSAPLRVQTVEALVRQADLAMYHAKRSGKNRYSFYHPSMLSESKRTADIASRLRRMDLDSELHLVFQPRMRLEGRELAGAEVLLRWRTPQGENIPPDVFVPVAEETGQILRIGYWVLEQGCRHLAEWGHLRDSLVLSINLSARQLFDEALLERIEEMRCRYNLAPAQLEFEITESSAMQDIDYAIRVLSRLRALGYGLSLDDFGTGYSSLSHLRQLPVDTIKIDRSFIEDLNENRQDRVMVAAIIELAAHLDMRVLAEGVEQAEQLEVLDSLGCDEAQGFYIGRPMSAEMFVHKARHWDDLSLAL